MRISSDPSVNVNCFQYALQSTCRGTWQALMGTDPVIPGAPPAIPAAFDNSTDPVPRNQALPNDIIIYLDQSGNIQHTTVVVGTNAGIPNTFYWRYQGSSVYEFWIGPNGVGMDGNEWARPWDTPMYYGAAAGPTTGWTWSPTGGGNGDQLYRGASGQSINCIWRAK
jgi:hypothetical protein